MVFTCSIRYCRHFQLSSLKVNRYCTISNYYKYLKIEFKNLYKLTNHSFVYISFALHLALYIYVTVSSSNLIGQVVFQIIFSATAMGLLMLLKLMP